MNGIVACTLSLPTNKSSCVIRIYLNKTHNSLPDLRWDIIGGSLFDIFPYGKTGRCSYFEAKLQIIGSYPGFAAPYFPVGPVVYDVAPDPYMVAELNNVPNNFLDTVTPQNTVRGDGKLGATEEKLNWSMWYRTN